MGILSLISVRNGSSMLSSCKNGTQHLTQTASVALDRSRETAVLAFCAAAPRSCKKSFRAVGKAFSKIRSVVKGCLNGQEVVSRSSERHEMRCLQARLPGPECSGCAAHSGACAATGLLPEAYKRRVRHVRPTLCFAMRRPECCRSMCEWLPRPLAGPERLRPRERLWRQVPAPSL